ncbi:MAG: hypothetical protein PWP20_549 [Eubacteriaceae bacterium]|jgi:mRNA-degrading endonuclease RelE of RelBE toxin-antitoxin system|nr:hypothetical protein [Eubacteriaceae bacterium]
MNIEIAITKSYLTALLKMPKNIQKKASDLIDKFKSQPEAASINYESIITMKDDKVRTIRVDQKYRAIILQPSEGNVYLFVYIDNHDEAMNWAKNKVFNINEYTSAIQVVDLDITRGPTESEAVSYDWLSIEEKSIADKYSKEELLSMGIPDIVIPVLSLIKTQNDLIKYVKEYVSTDILDILDFCLDGIPANEILDCFLVVPPETKPTMQEAMKKEINQSYIKVVSDEESIKNILDDPIDYWRIFIHPRQLQYVTGNKGHYNGSFQIKGSAGTGKTVVAMHRAKYLASSIYTSETDKILFTTFSKKLTKSVEYNLKNMCTMESLKRIEVINIHEWIAKYLKDHKIKFQIIDDQTRRKFITDAIQKLKLQDIYTVNDIITEIDVVMSFYQVSDLSTYLKVSRNGTYKKLGRLQRTQVWDIVSEYFEMLNEAEKTEWWLLIKTVIYMLNHKKDRSYTAIIIDESQDFGMPEYRLLRLLVEEKKDDLFIVGDIRQRIYNNKANFSKCNINIKGNRTRKLNINYRNTYEIGSFATNIIDGINFKEFDDIAFENVKASYVIRGDDPIIKNFMNKNLESDFVCNEINKIVSLGISYNEIAVIARTNKYLESIGERLRNEGINFSSFEEVNPIIRDSIYMGTMHGIKGFEFKVVFLIGVNDELLPLKSFLNHLKYENEIEAFVEREKSLLYVSLTRARDLVYVLSSDTKCAWV